MCILNKYNMNDDKIHYIVNYSKCIHEKWNNIHIIYFYVHPAITSKKAEVETKLWFITVMTTVVLLLQTCIITLFYKFVLNFFHNL